MMPGYLSNERATDLGAMLPTMPCRDPSDPERGTFRSENAPPGMHVADIMDAPPLKAAHEIAFDESPLTLAAEYFGTTPHVDSIQAWWSPPTHGKPEKTENFHRDKDGIRVFKFFLYLTDVDAGPGPYKFVLGSQVEPILLKRRRLTDEEVVATSGPDCIMTVTGRAGDAFIKNTFGGHKGQQTTSRARLLLRIRYSITPTILRSRLTVDASLSAKAIKTASIKNKN